MGSDLPPTSDKICLPQSFLEDKVIFYISLYNLYPTFSYQEDAIYYLFCLTTDIYISSTVPALNNLLYIWICFIL